MTAHKLLDNIEVVIRRASRELLIHKAATSAEQGSAHMDRLDMSSNYFLIITTIALIISDS
jgi:hypothetical protein